MTVVQKQAYKGLQFSELGSLSSIPRTWAISATEKYSTVANFTVDVHKHSYMFKDEVVLTLWSTRYPEVKLGAENDGYFRLEIPIPMRDFYELMMTVLPELHGRLNGIT